jgi:hypothetical protein
MPRSPSGSRRKSAREASGTNERRQPARERDENERDTRAKRQPQLTRTVRELVPRAAKLEKAIDTRQDATAAARTALMEFKEGLTLVSRVANSLINQRLPSEAEDEA